MERPKSAKYNIERVKKSSTYLNSKRAAAMVTTNLIQTSDGNAKSPLQQQQILDRFQQSKSAYIPRPQSARHNLDKYRQDVLVERERKLTYSTQENGSHLIDDPNQMIQISSTRPTVNQAQIYDLFMNEDDLDKLDTLLIREDADSSSSDIESTQSSPTINNNNNNNANINTLNNKVKLKPVNNTRNTNQNNKSNNSNNKSKESKLLSKRHTGGGLDTPTNSQQQTMQQLPNKSILLNQYTTFRPTAVTTNYSSSSPLVDSHQTALNLHPVISNNNNNVSQDQLNDTLVGDDSNSTNTNNNITDCGSNNINSSSSSTSTSSSSQKKQHLLVPSADSNSITYDNINNSTVKRDQLLKEWLKHDDEVELEIMTINPHHGLTRQPSSAFKNQEQPLKSLQQNRLANNGSSCNNNNNNNNNNYNFAGNNNINNRAVSRFSDHSSNSNASVKKNSGNFNTNNVSNNNNYNNVNNNNMNLFQTKERTNLIDPWSKRNPSLVAQNVLIKHRAELEQLAASTANNNSQISNTLTTVAGHHSYGGSSHLHHQTTTATGKYLLPDNKYFKNK